MVHTSRRTKRDQVAVVPAVAAPPTSRRSWRDRSRDTAPFDQLERIGCANNWTAKKVNSMKNELVLLKVWCEERDLWEDGKLTCLVTSEYL